MGNIICADIKDSKSLKVYIKINIQEKGFIRPKIIILGILSPVSLAEWIDQKNQAYLYLGELGCHRCIWGELRVNCSGIT